MRRPGRKKSVLVDAPTKCVVILSSKEEHDSVLAEKKEDKQLNRIMEFTDHNNLEPMKIFRRGIMGRRESDAIFFKAVNYMLSGKAAALVTVNVDAISYGIADAYYKVGIVNQAGFDFYTVDEKKVKLDLYQPPRKAGGAN